jgi:hypothetical protein
MWAMIRTIKKKEGKIEIVDEGEIEEYIAFDEMEEGWKSDSNVCDEDGVPYDMLDKEGNLKE